MLVDGEGCSSRLGQDVNTHATSDVTLIEDNGPQSRALEVILMLT